MKNLWPSTGIDSSRECAAGTSVIAFMRRSVAPRSSSMEAAVFNYSCRHTASICSCQAQMHKRCLLHLRICNVFSCGFKKLSVGAAWTVFMAKCCADHVKILHSLHLWLLACCLLFSSCSWSTVTNSTRCRRPCRKQQRDLHLWYNRWQPDADVCVVPQWRHRDGSAAGAERQVRNGAQSAFMGVDATRQRRAVHVRSRKRGDSISARGHPTDQRQMYVRKIGCQCVVFESCIFISSW